MEPYFSNTPQHRPCGCSFWALVYKGQLERGQRHRVMASHLSMCVGVARPGEKPQSTIGVCARTTWSKTRWAIQGAGTGGGMPLGSTFFLDLKFV
jgi:hypothetical protein